MTPRRQLFSPALKGVLLTGLLHLGACRSQEPLERLTTQLKDPSRRERAIDGLLVLVRETAASQQQEVKTRVVFALAEAYREDRNRGQIVSALALLRDPRAAEVFVSALRDAERGGEYFEAAIRSARLLGELGLKKHTLALVAALRKAHTSPRADRNTWLERTLVQALERLGDRRAVDVLVQVLTTEPTRQDFYLNKLAARALGRLGDPRAVPRLVSSLATTRHGLLLFEESRRALCRIGPAAVPELVRIASRRDPRDLPAPGAAAAVRVLGDLAPASLAARLAPLHRDKDPEGYQLALAETLLRLGHAPAETWLQALLRDEQASLTARREAADGLGWRGGPESIGPALESACAGEEPSRKVLCWSMALAFSRLAGPAGLARLDRLRQAGQDETTSSHLQTYRPRLVLISECAGDEACLRKGLGARDWRMRERAALELGRLGRAELAADLARLYPGEHEQVRQAILVCLEHLARIATLPDQVADLLLSVPAKPDKSTRRESDPLRSAVICFAERLRNR